MLVTKPTSRFLFFFITLLLFVCFILPITASESVTSADDDFDSEGFEELLKLDEEEEQGQGHEDTQVRSSEAEILTRAQRIVLELNNDNFKRVIDDNEFVMLLGYTPWCARSAELMPQFAEAATLLKDVGSSLVMTKVDAERYPKVASKLGIKGYPTLLLFVNGSSQAYTGGYTGEEIVIWARKKTGVPIIRLNSINEAEQFLKKHPMFFIGFFEKFEGPDYEEFVKAATEGNEIQFVETCNAEVAKVLFPDIATRNIFLGLVKSEPEKYVQFDDTFKKERILEFLEYNKFPLVTMLTELNSVRVFSSPVKLQVFIFARTDELKNHKELLQDVARKFKSKIMFLYVDITEENLAKPFLALFGHEESEDTIITAFDNRVSSKFLLESDLTMSNLEEFCSRLLQGTQPPYFKSEAVPDNKGKTVQTVVGRTFDDIVLDSSQNIFLEVHTPWCIDCEKTSKQIEKLAKHFKGLNSLIFARIDASTNEHPKLQQISSYPTLLFYPSTDKSNPIKVPAKSSLKDLAAFIKNKVRDAGDDEKPPQDQSTKDEL